MSKPKVDGNWWVQLKKNQPMTAKKIHYISDKMVTLGTMGIVNGGELVRYPIENVIFVELVAKGS